MALGRHILLNLTHRYQQPYLVIDKPRGGEQHDNEQQISPQRLVAGSFSGIGSHSSRFGGEEKKIATITIPAAPRYFSFHLFLPARNGPTPAPQLHAGHQHRPPFMTYTRGHHTFLIKRDEKQPLSTDQNAPRPATGFPFTSAACLPYPSPSSKTVRTGSVSQLYSDYLPFFIPHSYRNGKYEHTVGKSHRDKAYITTYFCSG